MRNGRFHPPKCKGKIQKTRKETLIGLFLKPPYSCYPLFCAHIVNSCWLAPTLAHPTQTSPKIFIYP
jgi:hypothetical protein